MSKINIEWLQKLKSKAEKIVALTAYDASFAKILDAAGMEIILVGDSLGMVLHGHADTLHVSMENMIYHIKQVATGTKNSMIVGDMPCASYLDKHDGFANAKRLVEEGGADMVKLERGDKNTCSIIEYIACHDIPVCAHLGLTPQFIKELGGYVVQGKDPATARQIQMDALAVEAAGASMLVLECVPATLAESITHALRIPVLGIGAGVACDGQVLVLYDILGISGYQLKLSKNFLADTAGSIQDAVLAYITAVKAGDFPIETQQ
ncbi:3-methyl-2-oxobutanoate hydroxymethyltransferase [uncultured Candidatus Thioglobus sp.]|nr:3-methyl-2-oxobutanoate hydroxymethyltransferase [uncultured Candidatus Thioglobus sp.]